MSAHNGWEGKATPEHSLFVSMLSSSPQSHALVVERAPSTSLSPSSQQQEDQHPEGQPCLRVLSSGILFSWGPQLMFFSWTNEQVRPLR